MEDEKLLQELITLKTMLQETGQQLIMISELIRAISSKLSLDTDEMAGGPKSAGGIYSLSMHASFFKGKSAEAVIFPDGQRVETPTWKTLVGAIMKRCNDNAQNHDALMSLRNRMQGRSRRLLGDTTEGMRSPIEIDNDLYMETHYDTGELLYIMKDRILSAVGYDFSGIQIAIRGK